VTETVSEDSQYHGRPLLIEAGFESMEDRALLLIVLVYLMAQVLLYGAEVIKVQSRHRTT
jgi:hypothetical protein